MTARKFSFTAYLAYIKHLPTTDRLAAWGMNVEQRCLPCDIHSESYDHLFSNCKYSTYLWRPKEVGSIASLLRLHCIVDFRV